MCIAARPGPVNLARWHRLLPATAAGLVLGLAAAAGGALPNGVGLIAPGEAIGPIRLGMTPAQVRSLSDSLPCEVAVAYTNGQASRLETNCGVAYQTSEGITVGLGGSRIRWVYGQPEVLVPSDLPGTRADWWVYRGPGISFRIIYSDSGTLIQAIAVFKGTGDLPVRRPGPIPLAPPLPPLGD
ncbi:MAG: hypothetical protein QN187_09455 [Armatimonadota bacterium]|nr:hypothetical protein [Armatimonadota bacterium]MDR7519386.1 hypothetical protein [Armatimonadota bacterium]